MMSSSKIACSHIYPNQSENYNSRRIRFWAEHFRKHSKLPVHRRSCHVKVKSFIHEDIARHCRLWLRSQNHNSIFAHGFCQWITKDLHVKAGLPSDIVVSQSTVASTRMDMKEQMSFNIEKVFSNEWHYTTKE
jgi:hypothetical protein